MNHNETQKKEIPIFDPEYLNQMVEVEKQLRKILIPSLIQSFHEMCEKFLLTSFRHAESKAFDVLKKDAHCLKSSCGQLGANKLAEICRQIETHSSVHLEDYLALLFEFKSLYPLSKAALEEYTRRTY